MAGVVWFSVGCALGATETETVDGIKWTYTVSGGIASLGGAGVKAVPTSTIGAIAIPSSLGGYPVRSIGYYAFYSCSGLTSVTIPDSVTNIVGGAFRECNSLESFSVADENPTYKSVSGLLLTKDGKTLVVGVNGDVVIPDSVTSIGYSAFYGCSNLTSVVIPDSVTSIGEFAFSGCSGLTSVTIGNGLKSIGSAAFGSTYGYITSVFIHDLAAWCEISFEEFSSNPLCDARHLYLDGEEVAGDLVIPAGTTSIGNWAFYNRIGLTNVTIPDSVTSIGREAFRDCSGLTGVAIGNGVTNIGDSAFSGCTDLTSVTLPDSVKYIGGGAFSQCSGLTDMTIPEGVMSIGEFAFSGCYGLTNVVIPDSVTSIGSDAFRGCDALYDTYSVQGVCLLDGWAVGRSQWVFGDLDLTGIRGIADRVFSYCDGLESVTIPDGVQRIGSWAFGGCSSLTNVTIPESVTSIGSNAFFDCSSLTSVAIPASLTSIENSAFENCYGLTAVFIHDLAAWCGISFEGYNPLEYAGHLYLDGEEVVNLVIPDGVTSIGRYAFSGCNGLVSVAIPSSVTNIGELAFLGCTNLTAVCIHDLTAWCGISFEGTAANPLYYAHHLYLDGEEAANLVISDGVASIGDYSFYGCGGLASVTIGNSVTNIGKSVFSACSNLATLYVPATWEGTSILDNAGVPSSCTVVYVTTTRVPCNWLEENAADILAANGGDYEAAASAMAPIGRPVWECYLTGAETAAGGTDFEVSLRIDDEGNWIVEWTPDLNDGQSQPVRDYRIEAKRELLDEDWTDVTGEEDLSSSGWNYFRVGVSLPE